MLLNQSLFSVYNHHHERKKLVKFHYNHLMQNTPKHVAEIHENKNKQEPKPNVPTPNHVLFEFGSTNTWKPVIKREPEPVIKPIEEPVEEPIEEPEPESTFDFGNENDMEYVVDDYIDMGNIYNSEYEKAEYNPMYFSLRHYISNK